MLNVQNASDTLHQKALLLGEWVSDSKNLLSGATYGWII